jgi:hypothetical protein
LRLRWRRRRRWLRHGWDRGSLEKGGGAKPSVFAATTDGAGGVERGFCGRAPVFFCCAWCPDAQSGPMALALCCESCKYDPVFILVNIKRFLLNLLGFLWMQGPQNHV